MNKPDLDFQWNVHQYLCGFIQFADAKATALLACCGTVIGWLCANDGLSVISRQHFASGTPEPWFAASSLGLLGLSFALCILVLAPNLSPSPTGKRQGKHSRGPDGLIFWRSILSRSRDDYVATVASDDAAHLALAHHIYSLASLLDEKYSRFTPAISLAALGTVLGVLFVWMK